MSRAFTAVATLLCFVAVGYTIKRLGWVDDRIESFLTRFSMRVTIPCALMKNALDNIDLQFFRDSGILLPIMFGILLCSFALMWGLTKRMRIREDRRGVVTVVMSLSNIIFIGLPVCSHFFGDRCIPAVMVYYLANTVIFWSVGTAFIARDAGKKVQSGVWPIVKRLFTSPPLIGFMAGAAISFAGLALPEFLDTAIRSVAGMNTPLCTMVAGIILGHRGLKQALRLPRDAVFTLIGRFAVAPLLTIAILTLLGVEALSAAVFTALSAMPVMNQSLIVTRDYGADSEFLGAVLPASLLIMMVVTPLTMAGISAWFGV